MNFNLNKAMAAGRLVRNPELKAIGEDNCVCNFTVAISRPYVAAAVDRKTDFIRCVAFKHQAQFVARYFKKGDPIFVEGEIRVDTWEKESGEKGSQTYLKVDDVRFVKGKDAGEAPEAKEEEPVPAGETPGEDLPLPKEG